ncbi:MAG: ChrR family anti-sigma-E factor [Pseudomonadota bacterium]
MKITHHPDDATLMSYAAGSLPASLSAVVWMHLTMCQTCRDRVESMGLIGAALFDDLPVDRKPIMLPAMDVAPRKFDDLPDPSADMDPLVQLVGRPLDEIHWKRLGFGVWHYPVPVRDSDRGDLRLLKVQRGQTMPEHGHGGSELTLILEGAYKDHIGEFRAGDVADLDDDVEHRPVADPDVGCICLIASEKKARFTGVIGRLLQPLTGI